MKRAFILVILSIFIALFLLPQQSLAQTSETSSITLSQGWNFISLPKQPPSTSINDVLKDISANVRVVWGYDNWQKQWLKYKGQVAGVTGQNTLTSMEAGKGYWIYLVGAGTIDMTGWTDPDKNIHLYEGWNLIGYLGEDGETVQTALSSTFDKWTVIWTWENGQWSAAHIIKHDLPVPVLSTMQKGKAYWVKTGAITDMDWGPIPLEARENAIALMASIPIPTTSRVMFAGPVEPGTILMEGSESETGAQLRLPDAQGSYYVFFIDDGPVARFAHDVRFAWVNKTDGTTGYIWATNRMRIKRPNAIFRPFTRIGMETIGGVVFHFMKGEGAPVNMGTEGTVSSQTVGRLPASLQENQLLPLLTPSETGQLKRAIVLDGGDEAVPDNQAADMAADADTMVSYLRSNGFFVDSISQYWMNREPYVRSKRVAGGDIKVMDESDLWSKFENVVNEFIQTPPAAVCHEFFIYIIAHGEENSRYGNFKVYPKLDNDEVFPLKADMTKLHRILKKLPYYVKVTIFLDTCFSGQLLGRAHMPFFESFCKDHCGLTIMTSADEHSTSYGRSGTYDSSTEDFMEGASEDKDGDGKVGGLKDRFLTMQGQTKPYKRKIKAGGDTVLQTSSHAMSWICKDQQSWCSLDKGPTPTSQAPAPLSVTITSPTDQDTYTASGPIVSLAANVTGTNITAVTWENSRGGSGNAQKTDNEKWSMNGISLQSGENIITVKAVTAETSAADTIKVIYTATKVSFTAPTNTGTFMVGNLGGNNSMFLGGAMSGPIDSIGDIIWVNSQGGSGTLLPGWVLSPFEVQLQPGENTITVKARDKTGNVISEDQIIVNSILQPNVSITSPSKDPKPVTDKSPIIISGTAFDPYGRVKKIEYSNSGSTNATATGTGTWAVSVALKSGDNSVQVMALDENNFPLASDTIIVTYNSPPQTLTITSPTSQDTYQTYKGTVDLAGTTANIPSSEFSKSRVAKWTVKNGDYQQGGETSMPSSDWSITGITLKPGANLITVGVMEYGYITPNPTDTITVTYNPPTEPMTQLWFGGTGDNDVNGACVGPSGGVYAVGTAKVQLGPVNGPAPQATDYNAYVRKFDSSLSSPNVVYLGGTGEERGNAVATDASDNVYVTGSTTSNAFPGASNTYSGSTDAFLAKLSPDLTQVLGVVYFGGSSIDRSYAVKTDGKNNVYIAGETLSAMLPGNVSCPASSGMNIFVAQFDSNLTLLRAACFGGTGDDSAKSIAIDGSGNIYISGNTRSPDFPLSAGGAQQTFGGLGQNPYPDGFIAKLSPLLTLVQSTYFGGIGQEFIPSILLSPEGSVYAVGWTSGLPDSYTNGGAQAVFGNAETTKTDCIKVDGFVAKFNSSLTVLERATYLGGSGETWDGDGATVLALHPTNGDLYAAGWTDSTNLTWTAGSAQQFHAADNASDGFVCRISPDLTAIGRCTYAGGAKTGYINEYPMAMVITSGDPVGTVWLFGRGNDWSNGSYTNDGFVITMSDSLQ